MKQITTNYTFNAAAKTIQSPDFVGIGLSGIALITNSTSNIIIYNFADPTKGGVLSGNTLTLTYNTGAMHNSDSLQIIFYDTTSVAKDTSLQKISQIEDSIQELISRLDFLPSVRGIAADLRVTLLSGVLTSVGTVTTVTTVTTVGTVSNQTNMGGYNAALPVIANVNMAAVLSNINNIY